MPKIYSAGDQLIATDYNEVVKTAGVYAASAAGDDDYEITVTPTPGTYAAGDVYHFKADVANTGACTLNVNSLGPKTIKKNVSQDLDDGDIQAGQLVDVIYDGTNFLLLSFPAGGLLQLLGSGSGSGATLSVGSLPARRWLRVVIRVAGFDTQDIPRIQFNADTGNNYAHAVSLNGAAESFTTGTAGVNLATANSTSERVYVLDIVNLNGVRKMVTGFGERWSNDTYEIHGNWTDGASEAQISSILLRGVSGNNLSANTAIYVYGMN